MENITTAETKPAPGAAISQQPQQEQKSSEQKRTPASSQDSKNPPQQSTGFWRQLVWPASVFACLIFLVLGPSIRYEFVNWDDPWYVINNPLIKSWSASNLYGIATETVTRNFAPVTIFSYLLDYTLWADWAGGYHLTNLLWHFINTLLVFVLIRQVTNKTSWAWGTALLFAIHPVQLESVIWISARKGLLSAAFMLLSLCFWLKQERTSRDELWGTCFYLIALFSKAVAVVLPGIVFVYDWLVRKKSFAEALSRQFVGLLIAIWFTLLTATSQQSVGGGLRHHFELSKLEMLGVDAVLFWDYLRMLVWPQNLSILYDPPLRGIPVTVGLAVVSWLLIGFWLWKVRHRHGLIVFAAASALAPLVPVINLFPITTIINDRYLYLPCIPLFAMGVAGLDWLAQTVARKIFSEKTDTEKTQQAKSKPMQAFMLATAITVLVGWYSFTSSQHLPTWKNDLAMWDNAVKVAPELPIAQYQRGISLWNAGRSEEAIHVINSALTLPRVDSFDRERMQAKLAEIEEQTSQPESPNISQTRDIHTTENK